MVNVRKTSFFLIILRLLGTFLKMASVLISARFFGASAERDIFVLAMSMTIILPNLTFGALSEIFRTKFVHIREASGLNDAIDSARTLIWYILFISIAIVVIGAVKADWLISLFSDNLSAELTDQLRLMIRLTLPIIILAQLSNYWTQALNCFESFYFPEVVSMISGIAGIVLVIFLAPVIGIYSLLASAYFTHALSLVVVLFLLRKKCPGFLALKLGRINEAMPYIMAALPFFIGFLIGQASAIVINRFSSGFGVGNVAILDYAQRIMSVPQSVVTSVIASVSTPILAAHFANGRNDDFARESLSFYRFLFILFAPCVFLTFFLSNELGSLLFANEISKQDLHKFSVTLSILAIGLFGIMHYIIFLQGLIAKGKNAAISAVVALNQIAILLCNILVAHRFGIWGFAASGGVFHLIAGLIFMSMLKIDFKDTLISLTKVVMLYALTFGAFFLTKNIFPVSGDISNIILSSLLFAVFLIAGLFVLKFEERKKIAKIFQNIIAVGGGNAKN